MEILLVILSVVGIILQATFIVVEHKEKWVPAVILKGSASLMFIAIGVIAYLFYNAPLIVVIGLILGGLGDVLLNLRFVFTKIGSKVFLAGVASFLAGHVLYLVYIINSNTPVIISLAIGVVVSTITLLIIFKVLEVKLSYKIFGIVYITAVSLMASMAIGNLFTQYSLSNLIYALGALSFFVSDIVLIFNSFGKAPKFSLRITNLSFYYIGQLLIGFSLFFLV